MSRLVLSRGKEQFWASVLAELDKAKKPHSWLEEFVQDSPTTLERAEWDGTLVMTLEAISLLAEELELNEFELDTLLHQAGYLAEEEWQESFLRWADGRIESEI